MAGQLYSDASVYIRGALLVEATDVTVDRKSGAQIVLTMAKGFAGASPGAPMLEISFDNAVPFAGVEYDPGADMLALGPVPITVYAAGKQLATQGFVMEDTFKKGVNKEATLSMKMTCDFAEWK